VSVLAASASDPINLVLVYAPGILDVEDFKKIALRVRANASNIDVYILQDKTQEMALVDRLAQRRTFVFSPTQLQAFTVTRGRVYAGRPMPKSEQLLRLELAGVPVPAWSMLDRGKRFDPAVWGDYVVVKPEISSGARGVRIAQTRSLNDASAAIEPYRRGANNLVVQKLVRNRAIGKIRIQTLFDEILFARLFRFPVQARFETAHDMQHYERLFSTDQSKAEDFDSPEVFALAKRCYRTFDDVAMLALDVLIDDAGQPFFIEANPGGNTWHFSSADRGQALRARGTFLERQFNAFELAGDVFTRRALDEAL
jgi:hypothetical protein